MTFTEDERRFMYAQVNEQYQNGKIRSQVPSGLLESLLSKLASVDVSFTEQESRWCQYLFQDLKDLYSRIADPRLQHLIQGGSGKMSGVGSFQQTGIAASGSGGDRYFSGPSTYLICISILNKLAGS